MPRRAAWKILRSGSPTPLREVDYLATRRGLEPRDRTLLRRLVGTEVRRRGTLRALVAAFARGKPSADLAAHLRLGLAQLFFMDRVPPHAAVSETVRATAETVSLPRGRYVNGVLRNALRARREGHCDDPRRDLVGRPWHLAEAVFRDPDEHPLLWMEDALSLPASLARRWVQRHGQGTARALAHLALEEAELSLVVTVGERAAMAAELAIGEVETLEGDHPRVLLAPASQVAPVLASAPFREGRLAIQGQTALRGAELVEARAGERVLELCAAPGGKTAVLAATGAWVLATDKSPARLAMVAPSLGRLAPTAQVRCVACDGTSAVAADAPFDAVLVDAPCSNTGVLAARPGARWRFGPANLRALTALQARLLDEAAAHLRPDGRLVYSTCSLEPEENAQQVRAFLQRHPGWELAREHESLPARARDGGPVDGGYHARIAAPGPVRNG